MGVTGVRSKRVTRQVQLNIYINETEFENTFLVVKGLSLDVILGNDFLERNKAVIDFNKKIVEFNKGSEPVRVNFKRVLDEVRVTGVKMIQNRVGDGDIETKVNICRESEIVENEEREMHVSDERVWENRAETFFNEGGVVGLSLIHI